MEQIKQLLIAVLQKMNLWEQNAKSIDELPDAPNVIPLAKIHISDNGTSKALELQKLIDASLSSAVNQITSIGEITVAGNDVTVPIATWKIANIGYSTIAPTIINVPFSATGTTRIDVFVANASNQIVKISGNDTTGIAIRPNLPLNTVIVTEINVSESALAPVPFPLTSEQIAAIQNANGPSASNPFATMDDIVAGGVSQLVDLTDVEIVSLADGQVLVWDATASKWKNQTVAGAGTPTLQLVTDEGANTTNPISVTDTGNNKISGVNGNIISVADLTSSESTAIESDGIVFINPAAATGVKVKASTQTGNVGELLIPDVGETPKTIALKEDLITNLQLYPTTASSPISGYNRMVTDISDADFDDTAVDVSTGSITGSDILIASLSSDAGILAGNPGVVNVSMVGNIKRVSGTATATFYYEIYHRDLAGNETLIGTSDHTTQVSSGTYVEFSASAVWNNGAFDSTDRIVYKLYGSKIGGGSNPTFQFQFGGTSPVRSYVPISASFLLQPIYEELDGKQGNAKLISANNTALDNDNLIVNATCTITDVASPSNGTNYTATIVNGSVTIGGVVYGMGVIVKRIYNSGSWKTCVVTDFEDWTDFSGTSTINGWSIPSIAFLRYSRVFKAVTVRGRITGTSNSTDTNLTIPFTIANFGVSQVNSSLFFTNNSIASGTPGTTIATNNSNQIQFFRDGTLASWTVGNTKTINFEITFIIQ